MSVNLSEAGIFRTLGHPFRLQLLEMLSAEETCVCHLAAYFQKPQPYVSKHLAELRDAGLVVDRREGQRVYYRLADPALRQVLESARVALRQLGRPDAGEAKALTPRYPLSGCDCPRCNGA